MMDVASWRYISRLLLHVFLILTSTGGMEWTSTTIRRDLLNGYDKYAPPEWNGEIDLLIQVHMYLRSVNNFDEVKGHLTSTVVFDVLWTDPRLTWDLNETQPEKVTFSSQTVWTPGLMLENGIDKVTLLDPEVSYIVQVNNTGLAHIGFVVVVMTKCFADVQYFPFDDHECNISLTVAEALYFGRKVRVRLFKAQTFPEILKRNGQWYIKEGTPVESMVVNVSLANFPILLERRSTFLLITLVVPIIFLCLVNPCVFIIPPKAGERTSFVIAVLLSFSVYMSIVAEQVPNTSDPLPVYTIFLTIKLFYSAAIAICSMAVVCMYEQNDQKPLPLWLRNFVLRFNNTNISEISVDKFQRLEINCDIPVQRNGRESEQSGSKQSLRPVLEGMDGGIEGIRYTKRQEDNPKQTEIQGEFINQGIRMGNSQKYQTRAHLRRVTWVEASHVFDKIFLALFSIFVGIEVAISFLLLALKTW